MPIDDTRRGRCYELSAKFVRDHPETTLVHGSVEGMGNPRMHHAWVLFPNTQVWEPLTKSVFPSAKAWVEFSKARVEATYTFDELMIMLTTSETWGPWHEVGKYA